GLLEPGEIVVVMTGSVVRGSGANTMKIHRVGTADLSDDPETRRRLRALIMQAPADETPGDSGASPSHSASADEQEGGAEQADRGHQSKTAPRASVYSPP